MCLVKQQLTTTDHTKTMCIGNTWGKKGLIVFFGVVIYIDCTDYRMIPLLWTDAMTNTVCYLHSQWVQSHLVSCMHPCVCLKRQHVLAAPGTARHATSRRSLSMFWLIVFHCVTLPHTTSHKSWSCTSAPCPERHLNLVCIRLKTETCSGLCGWMFDGNVHVHDTACMLWTFFWL